MNYEQNLRNLRNRICTDSSQDETKFLQIDSGLWRICNKTLRDDPQHKKKELSFVDWGVTLSDKLRQAFSEDLGALAEGSICSFYPVITDEKIAGLFGTEKSWNIQAADLQVQYYRLRFAESYWSAVRDMSIRSRSECISYFGLSVDIVDMIATATPNNINDFCHGNPSVHYFKLRCPQQDCLSILDIMHDQTLNAESRALKIALAKARKSNHCTVFNRVEFL